ncbi:MAG: ribonucleoside-diphosphate reductase, adenosylcobalamin-dependent, partial [Alphaproteobacteria bacterium]
RLVPIAVRMMDNVTDVSNFALPQQRHEAYAKRRIGLGVTGLADALILSGVRYGSAAAIELTERWTQAVARHAYLASAELAAEKGTFPLYEREKFLSSAFVAGLDEDVRETIAKHGMRNSHLTSIAPTGTISIFADNISSGLEPVFSFKYSRNVLMPDGTRREEEVSDYAYRLFRRLKGDNPPLPDYFVDAQSLAPRDHVVIQAAAQKHIDSSISKTINVPVDIGFDEFKEVYTLAYELGCKGCTTYRPNAVTGAVLEARKEKEAASPEPRLPLDEQPARHADAFEAGAVIYMTQPLDRPAALPGRTYKIRWADSDHAIYITVNDIVRDGRRRPFEVFINSKNMEHYAWTVGLTRMISAVFRRGGDVSFVVDELKAVFDPRGGQWMDGRYVPSLLAAIGEVIERHMIDIGFLPNPKEAREQFLERKVVGMPELALRQCPKCGQAALIRQEDCDVCTSCGYSKCG